MYGRSRGRGYAFGYQKSRPFGSSRPRSGDRDVMGGLSSTPMQVIARLSPRNDDPEVKVTELKHIGSYNWTDNTPAAIIVPGSPSLWRNRELPYQVQPDTGFHFKNQNSQRYPKAPLFPLFVAVDHSDAKEDFEWKTIDFITDRNNLRKLLRWISPDSEQDQANFRIDMQLAGANTVLLNRWENRDREEMSGKTFGFNFEKESTRLEAGCEDSTGHHRIVHYDLNGLKMIVRFEVDACLSDSGPLPQAVKTPDVDDLAALISGVDLGDRGAKSSTTTVKGIGNSNITVIHAGSLVKHSSLVELTTRSQRNVASFNWKDAYPQLFLSQTPHHFLAVHDRGWFLGVEKRQLDSAELHEIAARSIQGSFKTLVRVLDLVKKLVVQYGETGRLSLVCKDGVLSVYQRLSSDSLLPDDIMARFEDDSDDEE